MNETMYIGMGYLGAGIGAGLTLIGAGLGIGKLAAAALEGTARQPEAVGALRTTMLIAAALIEGVAFLALIVCLLGVMNFAKPTAAAERAPVVQTQAQ